MYKKLIEAFDKFSHNILLLYTQKDFITKAFDKEFLEINNSQKATKSHSLWFNNILKGGSREYLTYNQLTKDEISFELYKSYNRQLQFILVSACEFFQKYLDEIYSIIGFIDPTIWKEKHLKNINIDELSNKEKYTLNSFRKQVHNGATRLISNTDQLKQIRQYIPIFKIYELKDTKVDLYFNFILITELRHRIVHNDGVILNKDKFTKSIIKNQNNYDKNKTYYNDVINSFFRDEYNNTIMLTAQRNKNITYDILEPLIDNLVSYAKLIIDLSISKLKKNK